MPEFDTEKFLNTPIYAFDFQFMISDVKDFLEFAENNIDLQYQRELQEIAQRKDWDQFPPDYCEREHLEGGNQSSFSCESAPAYTLWRIVGIYNIS